MFPISTYLSNAQALANKELSNNKSLNNVVIMGQVNKMQMLGIRLNSQGFFISGYAEGKLEAAFENLNF